MVHDLNRSLLGRPFLLMESSPGPTNWYHHNRLLRPGMHRMKSLQAVAHGSDSVQYFQIRKGRGGAEKFHGAVIDHEGTEKPRMFKEVTQVGRDLEALRPVLGAGTRAQVGIIADWESSWHLKVANGPIAAVKGDASTNGLPHYLPYWRRGIAVDILNGDSPLDGYRVVIAPALFMLREGFAERVEKFVADGGTFVATWLTGIVNETGLCFRGGFPGPLRKVMGVWAEETDYLYEDETNEAVFVEGNAIGATGRATLNTVCDVVHPEGAEVVATYGREFYAGTPAVTRNVFGKGQAIYIAAHGDDAFYDAIHGALAKRLGLRRAIDADLPYGVTASVREKDGREFVFVQNFSNEPKTVDLGAKPRKDLLSGNAFSGETAIPAYGTVVLE
jgi:beta-galactosidase